MFATEWEEWTDCDDDQIESDEENSLASDEKNIVPMYGETKDDT